MVLIGFGVYLHLPLGRTSTQSHNLKPQVRLNYLTISFNENFNVGECMSASVRACKRVCVCACVLSVCVLAPAKERF